MEPASVRPGLRSIIHSTGGNNAIRTMQSCRMSRFSGLRLQQQPVDQGADRVVDQPGDIEFVDDVGSGISCRHVVIATA